MLEVFQGATLMVATIAVGLMAGVFSVYAHAFMPGLRGTDDRTFVGAFQAIDRAIINPWFLPVFMGALLVTALAAGLHLGEDTFPWILAALLLYLATVVITMRVNVPLNDAIKAAGDPDQIDLPTVRARFDESRWARWNVVRAVTSTVALACLAWALVEFGRL
jgi:uncharacterized membrane protein